MWPIAQCAAAGGAHIVDDSEVEAPGVCHFELWVTKFVPGDGYGNFGPACTPLKLPTVEIGAIYQHFWDKDINAPLLGPSVKWNLLPQSTGVGVALELNAGVNLRTGDLGLALVMVPVSIPINDKVRINLNAGWNYVGSDVISKNALFYGAQIEARIGFDTMIMIETFGRNPGAAGIQMGLRYTPKDGPIDFDLLAGSLLDGTSARFFTVGVTFRY